MCIWTGGHVRKQRSLYIVGRTRVHLDIVEDLGHFVELEVVLREDEPTEHGIAEGSFADRPIGYSDVAAH